VESRALLPMVVLEPATKQALVFALLAVFATMVSRAQATTSATRLASVWGLLMTPIAVRFQNYHQG
jgi:hypothetical protein